jgi:hypothetical protein
MGTRKYVICRSNMGVHAGELAEDESTDSKKVLYNVRRLWRWYSAFCLSELATDGPVKVTECKFSGEVRRTEITSPTNGFEILEVTDKAREVIASVKPCRP